MVERPCDPRQQNAKPHMFGAGNRRSGHHGGITFYVYQARNRPRIVAVENRITESKGNHEEQAEQCREPKRVELVVSEPAAMAGAIRRINLDRFHMRKARRASLACQGPGVSSRRSAGRRAGARFVLRVKMSFRGKQVSSENGHADRDYEKAPRGEEEPSSVGRSEERRVGKECRSR